MLLKHEFFFMLKGDYNWQICWSKDRGCHVVQNVKPSRQICDIGLFK